LDVPLLAEIGNNLKRKRESENVELPALKKQKLNTDGSDNFSENNYDVNKILMDLTGGMNDELYDSDHESKNEERPELNNQIVKLEQLSKPQLISLFSTLAGIDLNFKQELEKTLINMPRLESQAITSFKEKLIGKWDIFEVEDMTEQDLFNDSPPYIKFDDESLGYYKLAGLGGSIENGNVLSQCNGDPLFEFFCEDEKDNVRGEGWVFFNDDTLIGILNINNETFRFKSKRGVQMVDEEEDESTYDWDELQNEEKNEFIVQDDIVIEETNTDIQNDINDINDDINDINDDRNNNDELVIIDDDEVPNSEEKSEDKLQEILYEEEDDDDDMEGFIDLGDD